MTTMTRTARLAEVDLPDFGMPDALAGASGLDLRRPAGARSASGWRPRLRPARRLRRPRAQREPLVPDRVRPAVRGGDPRRRPGRRPGRPRRQRVLRDGRRRAAADATASCSRTSACRASRATGRGRSRRSSATTGSWPGRGSAWSAGRRTPTGGPARRAGVPRRRAADARRARRARSRTRRAC